MIFIMLYFHKLTILAKYFWDGPPLSMLVRVECVILFVKRLKLKEVMQQPALLQSSGSQT